MTRISSVVDFSQCFSARGERTASRSQSAPQTFEALPKAVSRNWRNIALAALRCSRDRLTTDCRGALYWLDDGVVET